MHVRHAWPTRSTGHSGANMNLTNLQVGIYWHQQFSDQKLWGSKDISGRGTYNSSTPDLPMLRWKSHLQLSRNFSSCLGLENTCGKDSSDLDRTIKHFLRNYSHHWRFRGSNWSHINSTRWKLSVLTIGNSPTPVCTSWSVCYLWAAWKRLSILQTTKWTTTLH